MTAATRTPRQRAPADPALRQRLQRLLAAASLEPEGMPPSAILVVRSLADPAPGRLRARAPDLRPPADWERAVRGALRDQLHAAARPARGVLPEGAAAVLFADQAELLAAFARDACAGVAGARWWWATLARGLGGSVDALVAMWLREPRHVPAAVEHLAAWGQAERVMSSLAPAQAARILAAVAHACDAPGLLAAPPAIVYREMETGDPGDGKRGAPASSSPDAIQSTLSSFEKDGERAMEVSPPWEMVLGRETVARSLGAEQRALLGVALTLHRAPLVARGPVFVSRFVRWRARAVSSARPAPAPTSPERAAPSPARVGASPSPSSERQASPSPSPERPASPSPDPAITAASGDGAPFISEALSGQKGQAREMETERDPSPESPVVPSAVRARDGARRSDAAAVDEARSGAAEVAWEEPLVRIVGPAIDAAETMSGACGVFFVINAVRSLGFFRALDEHFHLPSVIGGWGWIELLSRALLGPRAAGLAHDPVWRVLAGLDGREPEEPAGMGFVAPSVDTLPEAWAAILRGAGIDGPAPSPPLGIDPSPHLQRFLDLVVPFVRLRVEATLRAAGAEDELESALFRRVGLVQVTRSHVDVRMELDQVSVPVRFSGLDATPGWVPELARVVTFHFA